VEVEVEVEMRRCRVELLVQAIFKKRRRKNVKNAAELRGTRSEEDFFGGDVEGRTTYVQVA